DVSMAGLRFAARLQSQRHGGQQAPDHGDRGVPQRALLMRTHMTLALLPARARRPLRRFLRDKRGVSAVEFAMLLPLMITLYICGGEVASAIGCERKGEHGG